MTIPLYVLAVHFVADFLFQSDWMALNKSTRADALALHVSIYALTFGAALAPFYGSAYALRFAILTWLTHFATDYWTSRATSRLWFIKMTEVEKRWRVLAPDVVLREVQAKPSTGSADEDIVVARMSTEQMTYWVDVRPTRHWFFVVIGLDQLIHFGTLAATAAILTG